MEIKINGKKTPKLTLQVSGFVCSKLTMINDYPVSDFSVQLFTWNKFFEKNYHLMLKFICIIPTLQGKLWNVRMTFVFAKLEKIKLVSLV